MKTFGVSLRDDGLRFLCLDRYLWIKQWQSTENLLRPAL